MGKEMMAYTAIANLYDVRTGFESNAHLAVAMVNAFEASEVSIEVKSYALRAARMFDLQDHDEALAARIRRRFAD